MKIKTVTVNMIDEGEWNRLVSETYGRIYNFQQQEGCRNRGSYNFSIPSQFPDEDETYPDTVPEEVNHDQMCVNFKAWLARDPKQPLSGEEECDDHDIELWWQRNFYPRLESVAADLHAKGLLPAGDYIIDVDW